MSIPKRARKSKTKIRYPPFVPVFVSELKSKAYQELTGNAVKALTYFKRFDGIIKAKSGEYYNGIFDFTYSEALTIGFARSTFSRIIKELHKKGFIDIVKQGGKRGCGMSNSKYKLSARWEDYGTPRFISKSFYPTEPPAK